MGKAVLHQKRESCVKFGHILKDSFSENQNLFYEIIKQFRKEEFNKLNINDKEGTVITYKDSVVERWIQYFRELTESNIKIADSEEE